MSKRSKGESDELANIAESSKPSSSKRQNYLEWDDYFMATAILSSKRSKDPRTQVGACIVDKQNRIVAIGYNGFPRNCSDDEFSWQRHIKQLYVVHAEANAILNCNGNSLDGTRLFTTLFPCNECTKLIIQSGIKEIYFLTDKHGPIYQASKAMLDAVGIVYQKHVPKERMVVINFEEFVHEKE